jgi:hypothetical protein
MVEELGRKGEAGEHSADRSRPPIGRRRPEPEFTESPLFWWLYHHEPELSAMVTTGSIPWPLLAQKVLSLGIADGAGDRPSVAVMRATWARLLSLLRHPGRALLERYRPWQIPGIAAEPASLWTELVLLPRRPDPAHVPRPTDCRSKKGRTRRRRANAGALFWWLYEHHALLAPLTGAGGIRWTGLAEHLRKLGITNKWERPAAAATVQRTWQRLEEAIATEGQAALESCRPRWPAAPSLDPSGVAGRIPTPSALLFWSLFDLCPQISDLAKSGRVRWTVLAQRLARHGVTDTDGMALGPNIVEHTWRRVEKAMATEGRAALERRRPLDLAVPSLDLPCQNDLVLVPSPLFWWLLDHEHQVRALGVPGPIPWRAFTERIQQLGIGDSTGGLPGIDTTRMTWKRVTATLRAEDRSTIESRRPDRAPVLPVSAKWWQAIRRSVVLADRIKRRRATSARTALFWWIYDHRNQLQALEWRGRMSWTALCRRLSLLGLRDGSGRPVLPHLARATWSSVKQAIAADRV